MSIAVRRADYGNAEDAAAIVDMLNIYACDSMGGGEPLSPDVRRDLVPGLARFPNAFSLLAFCDGVLAGLANCFVSLSSFAAKPLVNIHDIVVAPESRGRGVARALFAEIERTAQAEGACKITLEVLSGNEPAKSLYTSLGYGDYVLDPAKGVALFWQKRLAA